MADTTIRRIDIRRCAAEELHGLVEQWRSDHDKAMAVRDLEDLIADATGLATDTVQLARSLVARFLRNEVRDPVLLGGAIRVLFAVVDRVCACLFEIVSTGLSDSYEIDGLTRLRTAWNGLAEATAWLKRVWPTIDELFDRDEMQEAVDAAERGELLTHEEVWRRLRGAS